MIIAVRGYAIHTGKQPLLKLLGSLEEQSIFLFDLLIAGNPPSRGSNLHNY
jgi:hypothetical protein